MQTPLKLFVVHVDGVYKSGLPKKQDTKVSVAVSSFTQNYSFSQFGCIIGVNCSEDHSCYLVVII